MHWFVKTATAYCTSPDMFMVDIYHCLLGLGVNQSWQWVMAVIFIFTSPLGCLIKLYGKHDSMILLFSLENPIHSKIIMSAQSGTIMKQANCAHNSLLDTLTISLTLWALHSGSPPFPVADVILGIASHHFPNNIPTPLGSPVLPFQTEPLFALPVKVVESNLLVEDLETCDAWMRVQKNIQKTVACQTTWWRASLEGQVRIQHSATFAVEAVSLYAASWYDSKYTRKLELNQRDFLFDDGQLMPM